MRLPPFEYHAPDTLEEALKIKSQLGASAAILAGGTDLVVNLKHRVFAPAALVSVKNVKEIKGIELKQDTLTIGAGTTLAEIAKNPDVQAHFPVLIKAVESIGAIGIQSFRGTVGGNICLQPRCILYNQSQFWRQGKGSCHRTGGKDCLALPDSESCQSICSGDTVPALLALSAMITITGAGGSKTIALSEFYTGKGETPFNLMPEEIVTEIRIPLPWAPISWSYQRVAYRSAVDFPLVNAAAVAILDKGKVENFKLAMSALGPAPVVLKDVEKSVKGSEPGPDLVNQARDMAHRAAEGIVVENACASRDYRIKMARVLAGRVVAKALGL